MRTTRLLAAAAAALILAGCGGGNGTTAAPEDPDQPDTAAPDEDAADDELVGTIVAAEPRDGGFALTVATQDGDEVEVDASTAATVQVRSEAGGWQRQRLSAWLDAGGPDAGYRFAFVERGGQVTELIER